MKLTYMCRCPLPTLLVVADQIRAMDGLEFEHWVADLFRRAGFQVEITQASGDHGVDLWASFGNHVVAVQCKRWDGMVGEPVLRDLCRGDDSRESSLRLFSHDWNIHSPSPPVLQGQIAVFGGIRCPYGSHKITHFTPLARFTVTLNRSNPRVIPTPSPTTAKVCCGRLGGPLYRGS